METVQKARKRGGQGASRPSRSTVLPTWEAPKFRPSGLFPELLLGVHSWLNHWPEVRVGAESAL